MKIRATFEFDVPDNVDDRGSIDHWVLNTMEHLSGFDTDEVPEHYKVKWGAINEHQRT